MLNKDKDSSKSQSKAKPSPISPTQQRSSLDGAEINTSYRSTFGGPEGISSDKWTSQKFGPQPTNVGRKPTPVQGIVPGLSNPTSPSSSTASPSKRHYHTNNSGSAGPSSPPPYATTPESLKNKTNYKEEDDPFAEATRAAAAAKKLDMTKETGGSGSSSGSSGGAGPPPPTTTTAPSINIKKSTALEMAAEIAAKAKAAAAAASKAAETAISNQHTNKHNDNTAAASSGEVRSLLSNLVSGNSYEQASAARQLSILTGGQDDDDDDGGGGGGGAAVAGIICAEGGVHTLHLCLDSNDMNVRDACTQVLTIIALSNGGQGRSEVLSAPPGGLARLIESMLLALEKGTQPSAGDFLAAIAGAQGQAAKAAFSRCKAVGRLASVAVGAADGRTKTAIAAASLRALHAFAAADRVYLKKMAWSGGLADLTRLLSIKVDPSLHLPALSLILASVKNHPSLSESLATPSCIASLSEYLGDPHYAVELQAGVAYILSKIAGLATYTTEAGNALMDHSLPRACEVLHNSQDIKNKKGGEGGEGGDETVMMLAGGSAAIVAHLMHGSRLCCHVVVYHTAVMKSTLTCLVMTRQFALAERFLYDSAEFAKDPGDILTSGY